MDEQPQQTLEQQTLEQQTIWALKNLPQRRAFEILRKGVGGVLTNDDKFSAFAKSIYGQARDNKLISNSLLEEDFQELLYLLNTLADSLSEYIDVNKIYKEKYKKDISTIITDTYKKLVSKEESDGYSTEFEREIGKSLFQQLEARDVDTGVRLEEALKILGTKINQEFESYQEKYSKESDPEKCIDIQKRWHEKLHNYKAWCDFFVERLMFSASREINDEFNQEVQQLQEEQKRKTYATEALALEVQKRLEGRVLEIRELYNKDLHDETQQLQEDANKFVTTFEKKFRIMDKGHRLVAASADLLGMKVPGEVKITDKSVVPGLIEHQIPNIEKPKLSKNSIVAVVAFAFGNPVKNQKFTVSCDLGGFSTRDLPGDLRTDESFQQIIRASQILTAAGISHLQYSLNPAQYTFKDSNSKDCTEPVEEFVKRIQKIFDVIVPKSTEFLKSAEDLNIFLQGCCKFDEFENARREIFKKATGCTSFIINEVTQSPNGVVRKKLTTDGDPQLPGCGTHLIEDSADGKLVSITNWINANCPDRIKTRGIDEENWSEEIDLGAEEIKQYPVFVQRLHKGQDPHIFQNGKIKKSTEEEVKKLDRRIWNTTQNIEQLNIFASKNQTIRKADALPLSDIKGYAHEAGSYDIHSQEEHESVLGKVLKVGRHKKPPQSFQSMIKEGETRYGSGQVIVDSDIAG